MLIQAMLTLFNNLDSDSKIAYKNSENGFAPPDPNHFVQKLKY